MQQTISLDGPLYALNEHSETGIPAVELDANLGSKVVLLFTSQDNARKYCYLRRPRASNSIIELTRKVIENRGVVQTGLIRVARTLYQGYPDITHFVIDHPGRQRGLAAYLPVDEVAGMGKKKTKTADEFKAALDEALSN